VIGYVERRLLATPLKREYPAHRLTPEWAGHIRHQLVARQVALDSAQDVHEEPLGDAREPPEVVSEIRLRHQ
jgi:hypothetical protein